MARSKLGKVFRARGFQVPRVCPRPLVCPLPADPSFQPRLRIWLRREVIEPPKVTEAPLHIPPPAIVYGAWKSIARTLYNHQDMAKYGVPGQTPPCLCHLVKRRVGESGGSGPIGDPPIRHVATAAQSLRGLSPAGLRLVSANAK